MIDYKLLKTNDLEEMVPENVQPFSGNGSDGPLYKISEDKLAKFAWAKTDSWERWYTLVSAKPRRVQHEHDICRYLYDNDVNVPEPIGVFKFKSFDWEWNPFLRFPAFVMKYIAGGVSAMPRYCDTEKQGAIDKAYREELEKVKDLDVVPGDLDLENVLWVPKEKKLYLLDFGKWMFEGESFRDIL